MTETGEDDLTRATAELGEPDVLFQVSRGRFLTKLAVGLLLMLFGVVGNYIWWVHGPATFGHFEILFLLGVPLTGLALLWHMYRNRGLFVLIYPTGLLRLRRGEVDSFPWSDIDHIRLKVQRASEARTEWDANNALVACWLPTEVPNFQLWKAWLTVAREDGIVAHFGPALSDYERLTEEVQRRSFAVLWPLVWDRFRAGHSIEFDDFEATASGLRHEKKLLPWHEVKELTVAQGKLSVKQAGKWLPWALVDIGGIPNPHLLFALVDEARRWHRTSKRQPQTRERDQRKESEPEA